MEHQLKLCSCWWLKLFILQYTTNPANDQWIDEHLSSSSLCFPVFHKVPEEFYMVNEDWNPIIHYQFLHLVNISITLAFKVPPPTIKRTCLVSPCVCVCLLSHVWLFAKPWTVFCHGPQSILQARILEQVAISSSRGSSWPRQPSCLASPALAGGFFTTVTSRKPPVKPLLIYINYIFCIIGHKPGFAMIFYSNYYFFLLMKSVLPTSLHP